MARRRMRSGSPQSQNYSSREFYHRRPTERRSRSPSWPDQRRSRNIGDVRRQPSDPKSSNRFSQQQQQHWSRRYHHDDHNGLSSSKSSRSRFHEPSSSNFFHHRDDADDYRSGRPRSHYDYHEPLSDFCRYNPDDYGQGDYYSSSFHDRRPLSHSNSSYSSSKLSYHGNNRGHRMSWSTYSQSSRGHNLSYNYEKSQLWSESRRSDQTRQRRRRRSPISSRYDYDEPSSNSHHHYRHDYRKIRTHRPPSYGHRFSSRNSSSRPKSSPYYNNNNHMSAASNFWETTHCPTFPDYLTLSQGVSPNPSPSPSPHWDFHSPCTPALSRSPGHSNLPSPCYSPSPSPHWDFRSPCTPTLSRSPSHSNLPSPCYSPNTPRSLTPIFEHTPNNNSVHSDDNFIIPTPSSIYSPTTAGMDSPSI